MYLQIFVNNQNNDRFYQCLLIAVCEGELQYECVEYESWIIVARFDVLLVCSSQTGFIKVFSDAPEPVVSKFSQLERLIRSLFIKNVYLWPKLV